MGQFMYVFKNPTTKKRKEKKVMATRKRKPTKRASRSKRRNPRTKVMSNGQQVSYITAKELKALEANAKHLTQIANSFAKDAKLLDKFDKGVLTPSEKGIITKALNSQNLVKQVKESSKRTLKAMQESNKKKDKLVKKLKKDGVTVVKTIEENLPMSPFKKSAEKILSLQGQLSKIKTKYSQLTQAEQKLKDELKQAKANANKAKTPADLQEALKVIDKLQKKINKMKIDKKKSNKGAKKVAKKTTKKKATKKAKKTAKKTTKKVAKKSTKKVAKKATKKVAKKTTKKSVSKRVNKKATKKTVAKKATKKSTKSKAKTGSKSKAKSKGKKKTKVFKKAMTLTEARNKLTKLLSKKKKGMTLAKGQSVRFKIKPRKKGGRPSTMTYKNNPMGGSMNVVEKYLKHDTFELAGLATGGVVGTGIERVIKKYVPSSILSKLPASFLGNGLGIASTLLAGVGLGILNEKKMQDSRLDALAKGMIGASTALAGKAVVEPMFIKENAELAPSNVSGLVEGGFDGLVEGGFDGLVEGGFNGLVEGGFNGWDGQDNDSYNSFAGYDDGEEEILY